MIGDSDSLISMLNLFLIHFYHCINCRCSLAFEIKCVVRPQCLETDYWSLILSIMQGYIIIRDEEAISSRIHDLAPKFLWEVKSHSLENKEKKLETVLICRKKFWAIIWDIFSTDRFSLHLRIGYLFHNLLANFFC